MARRDIRKVEGLIKVMTYALARSPDEFGLVPDQDGFVPVKEFIQALHEEPGWGYVRESHLNQALIHSEPGLFQVQEKRIRAANRYWRLEIEPWVEPPKILFTPIRRRAHRHVFERGLSPGGNRWVVLCTEWETALRIGKRKDPQPVILEILSLKASRGGIPLYRFGSLFLAKQITPEYIGGPLPPKQEPKKMPDSSKPKQKIQMDLGAGTFQLDMSRDPDPMRRSKGRKPRGWKEEARKFRRKRKH